MGCQVKAVMVVLSTVFSVSGLLLTLLSLLILSSPERDVRFDWCFVVLAVTGIVLVACIFYEWLRQLEG